MKLKISFHQKLLGAIVILLSLVAASATVAVQVSSQRYFQQASEGKLETSSRVAREYLSARRDQLALSIDVLVKDFGFKAAVATRDRATIDTAVLNHGARIGADLLLVTDPDGIVVSDPYELKQTLTLDAEVQKSGEQILHTIARPIEAPDLVGWLIVVFF